MVEPGPDWSGYLDGVAGFAGTLFALALAARQIRGRLVENPHPRVSRAQLIDSIAVTVELGAAASLGLLYMIHESLLFSIAVGTIAVCGVSLSVVSLITYLTALHGGLFTSGTNGARLEAWLQALGNLLPISCYVVAGLYAMHILQFDGEHEWGYAAAVSWLILSGTFQSIWWYARIWATEKRPAQ